MWLTTERRRGENNLSASYSASAGRTASPTCGGRTHLAQPRALARVRASPTVSPVRRYTAPGSGIGQSFDLGGKLEGGGGVQFRSFGEPGRGWEFLERGPKTQKVGAAEQVLMLSLPP